MTAGWQTLCSWACLGLSLCSDNCIVRESNETTRLGECQGGCDSDTGCNWGLNCFHKQSATDKVPGCNATDDGGNFSATSYCYVPPPGELVLVHDADDSPPNVPLGKCQGDCDSDLDCDYGLNCFERDGLELVDGCNGTGVSDKDYCYKPPPGTLVWMGDDLVPSRNFPLGACEGDCDEDSDCAGNLRCYQREGSEPTPGCTGRGIDEVDYCFDPEWFLDILIKEPSDAMFQQMSVNNVPLTSTGEPQLVLMGDRAENFPLGECQGDCNSDLDCAFGLSCFQTAVEGRFKRGQEAMTTVDGCSGIVTSFKDYCYNPPSKTLIRMGRDKQPAENYPLAICQGDCRDDTDCAGSLRCFHRTRTESVPGCSGAGVLGWNYCFDDGWALGRIAYRPGHGTVYQNGIQLSQGLRSRVIATSGSVVSFDVGIDASSIERFHRAPDGGAVFSRPETPGWVYVSNSESFTAGGVGAIYFNDQGQVIDYKRLLSGTVLNCGGGKTFWNTWISCEENDDGQVWEVDPWGSWSQVTVVGDIPANYESAAYDNRNVNDPKIYVTVDEINGPLLRFTPATAAVEYAVRTGNYRSLLNTTGPGLKHEYLVLDYNNRKSKEGTFSWTTNLIKARGSAFRHFQGLEGIDIRDGMLYMTAKVDKRLFILDLDKKTFKDTSTVSGAFDGQPDQVQRIVGADGKKSKLLYFCEDGGFHCGVHARDGTGEYYTILQTDTDPNTNGGVDMAGETTGLAFSPDNMFMYVSFQTRGRIVEVKRVDGLPFDGQRLDIKYHNDGSSFE